MGLFLAHKPVGPSSFQCLQDFRPQLEAATPGKRLKLCHAGTLDPFAEGLLLFLSGTSTRLMDLTHELPKQYLATVRWGVETHSGDHLGEELTRGDASALTAEKLDAALAPLLGWHEQTPPSTSAKKVEGEPAYKKVHRGEDVTLPPSRVYLHGARFLRHQLPASSELALTCRGGFYVRALVRDLGRTLGCGAHVSALTRTAVGPYFDPSPHSPPREMPTEDVFSWYGTLELTDAEVGALRQGQAITGVPPKRIRLPRWPWPEGFPPPSPRVRAVHQSRLLALLEPREKGELVRMLDLER